METMIDNILIARAMRNEANDQPWISISTIALLFGKPLHEVWEGYIGSRGFSPLHKALLNIENTLPEYLSAAYEQGILADLIDIRESRGRTALAWAVEYGWQEAVALLIKFHANPHQLRPSERGDSPLLQLASAGCGPNSSHNFMGVIRTLLEAGVNVNESDHEGWTALHVAASWQLYDVVVMLASYG